MKHIILATLILGYSIVAQASQEPVLASCPPERPLLSQKGGCYACDELKSFNVAYNADCSNLCQQSDGTYLRVSKGNVCRLKDCPSGTVRSKSHFGPHCIVEKPCPSDRPLLSKDGECYACDELNAIKLQNEEDCETKCLVDGQPSRNQSYWGCSLNQCPEGTYKDGFEKCVLEPTICPASHPLREKNGCYSCQYEKALDMDPDDIEKCLTACVDENNQPLRQIYRHFGCGVKSCPPDKPLLANGQCYACDEAEAVIAKNCEVCSDVRQTIRAMDEKYCVLKTCPTDKPLIAFDGSCYSCDKPETVYVTSGTCKSACPNRIPEEDIYSGDGGEECRLTEDAPRFIIQKTKKATRPIVACTDDKPLKDYQGGCYACDNPSVVYTNKTECAKCANRKVGGTWSFDNDGQKDEGIMCSLK